MKKKLWTKNFTLLIIATILGGIGGIAGNFAMSFLVYDETGSTLASAIIVAVAFIPGFIIPIFAAPYMDRLPRKLFLVGGDLVNGLLYTLAGFYLLKMPFSYAGYVCFSLLLQSLGSFDMLAYNSIYPNLIPEGMEQKGYAVSSMVYPVLMVIMMPIAAWLMDTIGVAWILIIQGTLSMLAACIESGIKINEEKRMNGEKFSFNLWKRDIKDALEFIKREKGIGYSYLYTGFANGIANGYGPIMIAFFRTAPGFTVAMYSFFSVAECIGRAIGGLFHYNLKIKKEKKFNLCFFIYEFYDLMDACLLFLPYPFMLLNRAVCGFLGSNSASLREAALQSYIPDEYRARVIAFSDILFFAMGGILSLLIGALGEVLDYRLCMLVCGVSGMLFAYFIIWRKRKYTKQIFTEKANI